MLEHPTLESASTLQINALQSLLLPCLVETHVSEQPIIWLENNPSGIRCWKRICINPQVCRSIKNCVERPEGS